jgi:hypothetical protein
MATQRRHHQEKHQLRRQLDPRQPGRHRDDETDEDEKNGGGDSGPVCYDRDRRHCHENENQD